MNKIFDKKLKVLGIIYLDNILIYSVEKSHIILYMEFSLFKKKRPLYHAKKFDFYLSKLTFFHFILFLY